jgi:tetratricopeptide (TPR) repeat protein
LFATGAYTDALKTLDEEIAGGLDSAEAFNLRGMVQQQLGDAAAALGAYEAALVREPGFAPALNNRGLLYLAEGETALAQTDFEQAIAANPAAPDAYLHLGLLHYLEGDHAAAIPHLQKSSELAPGQSDPLYQLGLAYARAGRPEDAAAAFTRVIEIEGGFDRQAYYQRGLALADMGSAGNKSSYDLAAADFDAAIARGLLNEDIYFYRGLMRYHQGRLEEALADMVEALRMQPEYAEAHYYRAFILARLGRQDEAIAAAQKAVELAPPPATGEQ